MELIDAGSGVAGGATPLDRIMRHLRAAGDEQGERLVRDLAFAAERTMVVADAELPADHPVLNVLQDEVRPAVTELLGEET